MSILVVSVSHQTAPMELLSQMTLDQARARAVTRSLIASDHVEEAVVLSTCNRTEIYASVSRFHGGLAALTQTVEDVVGVSVETLQENCAVFYDEAAVGHCFTVTSGLDSMVAGEHQILGQVRKAFGESQEAGSVGTALHALFQQALRVGKRVQTETSAGTAGRSLVTAALDQLGDHGVTAEGKQVLVVGAGSMAGLAAHTVAERGAHVVLVNRTFDKAQRLALAVGGTARPMEELPAALAEADLVITCTGARAMRLTLSDFAGTSVRGVIDLALPADVDPEVSDLPGGVLVNLDSLAKASHGGSITDGLGAGTAEIAEAQELVMSEVQAFLGLRRAASVAPTVVALRSMAAGVMTSELARLNSRLPDLDDQSRAEVEQALRRVVEKLLHQPMVRVKQLASMPDTPDYAAALRELFALDTSAIDAVTSSR